VHIAYMIDNHTLKEIKVCALSADWDNAFQGASKGNRHLERVVRIAQYLAEAEGADLGVVTAGAWLHDLSLPTGDDYNYDVSKKHAQHVLHQFEITPNEREAIAECIASHEGVVPPRTHEAEIVHDADVLEKSGILGLVRHTWKLVHTGVIAPELVNDEDVKTVRNHIIWRERQLHSSTAKHLLTMVSATIDDFQARIIIQKTARMAGQGLITEVIAKQLMPFLNMDQQRHLALQLDLSHLDVRA